MRRGVRLGQVIIGLPASGYRDRVSGALAYVGTNVCAWSSSPNASGVVNAGSLFFSASNVYPLYNGDPRSFGLPVRCVRGFTSAWEGCPALWRGVRLGQVIIDLPASGYRYRSSGAVGAGIGAVSYWWSSSPSAAGNVLAGHLYFGASVVSPLLDSSRSSSVPVRCVREFTAAWKECAPLARVLGHGCRCSMAVGRSVSPLRATASTCLASCRVSAWVAGRGPALRMPRAVSSQVIWASP